MLVIMLCGTLSCAGLAQSRPPDFALSKPGVIRFDSDKQDNVTMSIHVWRREYNLPGSNLAQVRANLVALGLGGTQEDFSAYTKWDLTWSVHFEKGDDGCSIGSAGIEVDSMITLPALQDESRLSPSDLAEWQRYAGALEEHELSHVENEVAGAHALRDALSGPGAAADCKTLGSQIESLGNQQKQAIRTADDELDVKTEHGALTGATFR